LLLVTLRPPPASPPLPCTTLFRSPEAISVRAAPHARERQWICRPGDALQPISRKTLSMWNGTECSTSIRPPASSSRAARLNARRSEEHTSELQSRENLVCRLLLEK